MTKAFYEEILEPENEDQKQQIKNDFWFTLKKAASAIPFATDLVASYYCAMDTHTPTRVRIVLVSALAYFVLPIDAVPDFLVGLGFTDDAAILITAITAVRSHITPAHVKAAQDTLQTNS